MDFFKLTFKYMIRVIDMIAYTYYSLCNVCLCHKVMAVASSHFGINLIKLFIKRLLFSIFFPNLFNALFINMFPVLKMKILTPIYFHSDFFVWQNRSWNENSCDFIIVIFVLLDTCQSLYLFSFLLPYSSAGGCSKNNSSNRCYTHG